MAKIFNTKLAKSILTLGLPLIVGELGSITQQFADTMMVGHYGTTELAASSFVNSIFLFVIFIALGMSYAVTPIVGSAYGKKDYSAILKTMRETIWVNLIVAAIIVTSLLAAYSHLEVFHQPGEILEKAQIYLGLLTLSVPLLTVFNGLKQILDGLGKTRVSMWILLGSNGLNIFLNWILIFGKFGCPELGLTGAGVSTLISRFVQLFLISIAIHTTKKRVILSSLVSKTDSKPTIAGVWYQLKLGFPISIQLALEIGLFNICGIFMGWISVPALAAHQAMYTLSTICFQLLYGIAAAESILISQYHGSGDISRIKETSRTALTLGMFTAGTLIFIIYTGFQFIAPWFTNDSDVIEVMKYILPCFAAYQIGDCFQITYANALRGIEKTKPLMYIASFAYILVGAPLSYFFIFSLDMGAHGAWLGVPFALTLAGILFYLKFHKSMKKLTLA